MLRKHLTLSNIIFFYNTNVTFYIFYTSYILFYYPKLNQANTKYVKKTL